jgi:hypothetical protein
MDQIHPTITKVECQSNFLVYVIDDVMNIYSKPIMIPNKLIFPVPHQHWLSNVPIPGKNMFITKSKVALDGDVGLIVARHYSITIVF